MKLVHRILKLLVLDENALLKDGVFSEELHDNFLVLSLILSPQLLYMHINKQDDDSLPL